jgi:hypothetical protein
MCILFIHTQTHTHTHTHTHIHTHTHTGSGARPVGADVSDAEAAGVTSTGTQFTCFTGTRVPILTHCCSTAHQALVRNAPRIRRRQSLRRYIYIYIHVCACVCVCVCVCVCIDTHTHIYTYIDTYIDTYTDTNVCIHT